MEITNEVIEHINLALNIELKWWQAGYIANGHSSYFRLESGRRVGRTTAYIIRLILSDGEPLNMYYPERYSDYGKIGYARGFFRNEFIRIYDTLKEYGFPVRKIYFKR